MFQVGRKAAELERVKLQTEIQKRKERDQKEETRKAIEDGWKSRRSKQYGEIPEENENQAGTGR